MEYAFESLGPTLRYVALAFMLAFTVVALLVIVLLAALPGQIAKRTGHPQANAINICGWLGLPTGILWVVAMVWACIRRPSQLSEVGSFASNEFEQQIKKLEEAIEQLEKQVGN